MRAFSTLRILPRIGRIAWTRGSRPCRADPPAESPSTMKTSHSSGLVDWQSDSLPGSPPPPSRPLRPRARSRALRAAIRALAAACALRTMSRPSAGFCSSQAPSWSLTTRWTKPLASVLPSLALVWPSNCGVGELDRDDRGQALADVVARDAVLTLLDQAPLLAPVVDQRGQRRAEALLVGAALGGVDGVGEGVHRLGERDVPLHRDLEAEVLRRALDPGALLGLERDHRRVGQGLALVEVLDEVDEAAVVAEGLLDPAGLGLVDRVGADPVDLVGDRVVLRPPRAPRPPPVARRGPRSRGPC